MDLTCKPGVIFNYGLIPTLAPMLIMKKGIAELQEQISLGPEQKPNDACFPKKKERKVALCVPHLVSFSQKCSVCTPK